MCINKKQNKNTIKPKMGNGCCASIPPEKEIITKILKTKFYWRSDADPFSPEENSKWEPFAEEDDLLLEDAYQKYIAKIGPSEISLKKASQYKVSFILWKEISVKSPFLQRPIKREEEADKLKSYPNEKILKPKQPAQYFWRSDRNHFSSEIHASWECYHEEDNLIIEEAYQEFLLNNLTEIKLRKASDYKINFQLWKQISLNNSSAQRAIKRELQKNFIEIPEYFWRSDQNPFSSEENAIWTPYDYGDSIFLEKSYNDYLGGQGPVEIDLGKAYRINFKHWLQKSKHDPDKQRPILRSLSKRQNSSSERIDGTVLKILN